MKRFVKLALIVFGSLALLAALSLFFGTRNMATVKNAVVQHTDLDSLPDGVYSGVSDVGRWSVEVAVTLRNHAITAITVTDRKSSNLTKSIIENVNQRVIEHQSAAVDAVGGATMTSKGYLIAIGNALALAR